MPSAVIAAIPHNDTEIHLWCLYSAILFIILSMLNHIMRRRWAEFGALTAIKQGVAGLAFPYSMILFLIYADESLIKTITDIPKFLVIAGIALTVISVASLFRIG
jgi:hypothetical protein